MSPGKLDASVVRRHLLALDDALRTLRRHQGRPLERLHQDREELWVVERGLQLCAQNALDIAAHLAATAGRDVADYASAIDRLVELQIVPADFAARFRSIAGLRNIIVHGYLEIDPAVLHRLLEERLDDFAIFARHVDGFLASRLDG